MSDFEKALEERADKQRLETGYRPYVTKAQFIEGARWAREWCDKNHEPDFMHSIKYSIVEKLREENQSLAEAYGLQSQALAEYDERIRSELAENTALQFANQKLEARIEKLRAALEDIKSRIINVDSSAVKQIEQALAETEGE